MATVKTLLGYVKGPKGDQGEQGIQGVAGNDGIAASVQVGTTTTADPGSMARVVNVGTSSNAILNFTIPKGDQGNVGDIANVPVNEIADISESYPLPEIGDAVSTIVGKQRKATTDAKSDIEKILGDFANVESGSSASKAYAVSDYLVKDGKLYKVTAAIAQGNALVVGGNIQATTVGAEVTSLNNDIALPRLAPHDTFTGLVIAANFIFIPADRVYINKNTFTVAYIDIYNVAILTSYVASVGRVMNGIMVEITGYDMNPYIGRFSVARLLPLV